MKPWLVGMVLAFAVAGPGSLADEATLLDEVGAGIVPVNTETILKVRAVEGEIAIQAGKQGEIQFQSTSLDKQDEEIPLAVWTDGGAFRLEPPRGQTTARSRLRVSIPAGMSVRLDLDNATVSIGGIDGDLAVHGRQIKLDAAGLLQTANLEIEGGGVNVQGAAKGLTMVGRNLDVVLDGIAGQSQLRLNGGSAKLSSMLAGLKGEFTGTSVAIDTISGFVNLHFLKGTAQIAGLRDGGELVLQGCPLRMDRASGEVAITSDSGVQLNDCRASIHVESSGGAVTGRMNDGLLEIKTYSAQVALEQITGQLRIAGDDLDVKLQDIGASLSVSTRSSSLSVDGASGTVTVENDQGDVTIKRAGGEVDLKTRHGDVDLHELHGPITVQADGTRVEAEWSAVSIGKDSRINNEGGDVTVRFPAAGGCRVDAKSRSGRIDSDLPKLSISDDGGSAQGLVGNGGPKTIFVEASGDVHLLAGTVPEPSEPSEQAP